MPVSVWCTARLHGVSLPRLPPHRSWGTSRLSPFLGWQEFGTGGGQRAIASTPQPALKYSTAQRLVGRSNHRAKHTTWASPSCMAAVVRLPAAVIPHAGTLPQPCSPVPVPVPSPVLCLRREAKPMHPLSYGMFAGRDSLTILASFTLPPKLAKAAKEATGLSDTMCENTAQLVTPCAMQILSTPGHLYGLDLYNRPVVEAGGPSRAAFIRREYVKTCAARMARIFPAFGVGGVVNANVRRLGKQWLLSTSGTPAVSAN